MHPNNDAGRIFFTVKAGISDKKTGIFIWDAPSFLSFRQKKSFFCLKPENAPYTITKTYAEKLRQKIGTFKAETATRKAVWLAILTTFGLKKNEYSGSLVQHNLTMDCLFM